MSERSLNITDINCPDRGSQTYFVVVTILACLLNFILFKLIQKESSASLKPFQIVLYTSCYVNAISALLQFSTQARPSTLGSKEILTMNLDGPLPALMEDFTLFHRGNLAYFVIIEYFGCYISLIYGLLPCFFRYATICWSYTLSARQYMLLFVFVLLLSLVQSTVICYLSVVHYEQNIELIEVIPNDKCTRFVPQFNTNNKATPLQIRVFLMWIVIQYFFEYSFVVVIFFMLCIYISLRRQAQLMEYSRAQIQLTWTIGVQTAIPIVCVHMPMIISFMGANFNPAWSSFGYQMLFTCYSIGPFLSPLVAIYFIERYRLSVQYLICKGISFVPGMKHWSNKINIEHSIFIRPSQKHLKSTTHPV